MADIFSIAVVGFGGMGEWHTNLIKTINGIQLAGIYDIDPKRTEYAQQKDIKAYKTLEELLADKSIDLVTVATPNDTHLPIVVKALQAGKNVVCEKPVAMNSTELEQMMNEAKRQGKIFTVHQNRRWDEDFRTVKEIYESGTLGEVFNIESRVHGSRGIPGDWRTKKEHGGGMMLDWGVHLIDQICTMLPNKKISSVYAQLSHVTCGEVDDGFRLIMQFENGPSCLIEVGTSNFISQNRWYVQGQNGTALVKNWEREGEIVKVSNWEKRDAVPVVTAAGLTKTMAPRTEETIISEALPLPTADISDFYKNVRGAVQNGDELIVKPQECMRVMRIMETAFEAAEKNEVIKTQL